MKFEILIGHIISCSFLKAEGEFIYIDHCLPILIQSQYPNKFQTKVIHN